MKKILTLLLLSAATASAGPVPTFMNEAQARWSDLLGRVVKTETAFALDAAALSLLCCASAFGIWWAIKRVR